MMLNDTNGFRLEEPC